MWKNLLILVTLLILVYIKMRHDEKMMSGEGLTMEDLST